MISAQSQVFDMDVDVACPVCRYPVWVRMVEVVAHTAVLCPVCRAHLWLVDADASVEGVSREIDRVIGDAVEGLNTTLRRTFG